MEYDASLPPVKTVYRMSEDAVQALRKDFQSVPLFHGKDEPSPQYDILQKNLDWPQYCEQFEGKRLLFLGYGANGCLAESISSCVQHLQGAFTVATWGGTDIGAQSVDCVVVVDVGGQLLTDGTDLLEICKRFPKVLHLVIAPGCTDHCSCEDMEKAVSDSKDSFMGAFAMPSTVLCQVETMSSRAAVILQAAARGSLGGPLERLNHSDIPIRWLRHCLLFETMQ